MKLRLTALSLAAGLAGLTALAQDNSPPAPPLPPAAPAPPAPPPVTPGAPPAAPGAPGAPGLLPPAQGVPVEEPDSFKSEKERQSYAVGWLFANREKTSASSAGAVAPGSDEVIAGMRDVLNGGKSLDYAVGAMLAMQIRRNEVDVDLETLFAAVSDSLGNQPAKLTPSQQQTVLQRVQNDVRMRMETRQKAEQEKALKASADFLAANAKAEGVKTTASGLQYKIEKPGDGKSATESDIVTINYTATAADGTEFEKNPPTGPGRKAVRALPKGIQEALTMLKTGGKGKFWVPPALGYGENGRMPQVKPNAVLVYDIEFVSVEPLPKPPVNAINPNQPPRGPVTAVTPPITVEIPPRPGDKPAVPPKTPPTPPPPPPAPIPPPPPPAPPK